MLNTISQVQHIRRAASSRVHITLSSHCIIHNSPSPPLSECVEEACWVVLLNMFYSFTHCLAHSPLCSVSLPLSFFSEKYKKYCFFAILLSSKHSLSKSGQCLVNDEAKILFVVVYYQLFPNDTAPFCRPGDDRSDHRLQEGGHQPRQRGHAHRCQPGRFDHPVPAGRGQQHTLRVYRWGDTGTQRHDGSPPPSPQSCLCIFPPIESNEKQHFDSADHTWYLQKPHLFSQMAWCFSIC